MALALADTCTCTGAVAVAVGVLVADAVPVAASSWDGRVAEPVVWDSGDAGAERVLVAVLALLGPGVDGGTDAVWAGATWAGAVDDPAGRATDDTGVPVLVPVGDGVTVGESVAVAVGVAVAVSVGSGPGVGVAVVVSRASAVAVSRVGRRWAKGRGGGGGGTPEKRSARSRRSMTNIT